MAALLQPGACREAATLQVPKGLGLAWETSPKTESGHHTTSYDYKFSTQGSEAGPSHTPRPIRPACPPASTSSSQPDRPRNGQGRRSTIRCIGERRDEAPSGCLPGAATLAVCWGVRRNRSSWGSAGKDELQGRLDVTARGLQGSQAQLVVLDAHVT